MIKIRTKNPAVGTASNSVSQYDQEVLRYIKYHIPQNGSSELATCHQLFQRVGCLYLAIVPAQGAGSGIDAGDKAFIDELLTPASDFCGLRCLANFGQETVAATAVFVNAPFCPVSPT
jgi:hypothetical protein